MKPRKVLDDMKKALILLIVTLIIILIPGCEKNSQVEIQELKGAIDTLIIKNNDLITLTNDLKLVTEELKNDLDKVNQSLVPIAVNDENFIKDEDITNIYNKALKIYYWFYVSTMTPNNNEKVVIDNQTYYKIDDEISSYQELVKYMQSVLDYKIVDELLSRNSYKDINGELYGLNGDRGTNILKGEEIREIIRVDKNTILFKVTVEMLDDSGKIIDYETNDFFLRYYTDNKWRFEEFYLFR